MDFVVVGFGVGALGVLLGVLLRGWLAGRRERAALRAADPALAAYERANAAECRGAGQAFLAAGGAVVLATAGGLAGGLDDRSGALLVTTTATVAALGIIVWGVLHRSRHPMPPRPRRLAPAAAPALPMDDRFAVADVATAGPALAGAHNANGAAGETMPDVEEAERPAPIEPPTLVADPGLEAEESRADGAGLRAMESAPNDQSQDGAGAETGEIVAFGARRSGAADEEPAAEGDEPAADR